MDYLKEIDALQRWVFQSTGFGSVRLAEAPPKVPRPVILWENPQRSRARNLDFYTYVTRVRQHGKLYVTSFDQAAEVQENLIKALENKQGVLEVYETTSSTEATAILQRVTVDFGSAETLDVPFIVTYEATYSRATPEPIPPAAHVSLKFRYGTNDAGG